MNCFTIFPLPFFCLISVLSNRISIFAFLLCQQGHRFDPLLLWGLIPLRPPSLTLVYRSLAISESNIPSPARLLYKSLRSFSISSLSYPPLLL